MYILCTACILGHQVCHLVNLSYPYLRNLSHCRFEDMEIRRPVNADQRKLRSLMWEPGDDRAEAKLSGMQTDEQECISLGLSTRSRLRQFCMYCSYCTRSHQQRTNVSADLRLLPLRCHSLTPPQTGSPSFLQTQLVQVLPDMIDDTFGPDADNFRAQEPTSGRPTNITPAPASQLGLCRSALQQDKMEYAKSSEAT